jgi:hypothetical protein
MKFIHRLGYYLGGFAVGLIILAFILSGKNASCDYGPNARTTKNISSKPLVFTEQAKENSISYDLDSITVIQLIKYGTVDFSKSIIDKDSCNTYYIENTYKERQVILSVFNCDEQAILKNLNIK